MDEKNQDSIGYAFKGKIMISSITILFSACFVIVAFHVYSRWCRRRHRHSDDNHLRRLAVSVPAPSPAAAVLTSQGLDLRAVNSLPTFVFESEKKESPAECAVCLSEFEKGETGRILPDCKHSFHVACIDAWLQSHRHCPLCRTRVKGQVPPEYTVVSILALEGTVHGSGSGSSPTAESSKAIGGSESDTAIRD